MSEFLSFLVTALVIFWFCGARVWLYLKYQPCTMGPLSQQNGLGLEEWLPDTGATYEYMD
jgi:hypothetical protein